MFERRNHDRIDLRHWARFRYTRCHRFGALPLADIVALAAALASLEDETSRALTAHADRGEQRRARYGPRGGDVGVVHCQARLHLVVLAFGNDRRDFHRDPFGAVARQRSPAILLVVVEGARIGLAPKQVAQRAAQEWVVAQRDVFGLSWVQIAFSPSERPPSPFK